MFRRLVAIAVAVAIPLVVLATVMLRAERQLGSNRRWAFEIAGYDPRDLLRGHYIRFRLNLDETPDAPGAGEACKDGGPGRCCLCLSADAPGAPTRVTRMQCRTALASCEGALDTSYLEQLDRYYIGEKNAARRTQLVEEAARERQALLIVAVDRFGKPQIESLLVRGVRVEDLE